MSGLMSMTSCSQLVRMTSLTMALMRWLLRVPMRSRTMAGSSPGESMPARSAVVEVVVYVRYPVGYAHDVGLQAAARGAGGVVEDAYARLVAEVQPLAVLLQPVHHAQALLVVAEAAGEDVVQRPLAGVAEGGVTQVVPRAMASVKSSLRRSARDIVLATRATSSVWVSLVR